MDWNEVLTNLLIAVITVFVPVLGALAVQFLRKKMTELDTYAALKLGQSHWWFAKEIAQQFVEAAEQRGVWDDLLEEGKDKKTWVLGQVDQILKRYGVDLDESAIDAAIEQAVKSMNWNHTEMS